MTDLVFSSSTVTSAIPSARIVFQANHLVAGRADTLTSLTATISITAGTVIDDMGAVTFGFPLTNASSSVNMVTTPPLHATTDSTGAGRHLRTIDGGAAHYTLTVTGSIAGSEFTASHRFDVDAETPDLALFTDLASVPGSVLFPVLSASARTALETVVDDRIAGLLGWTTVVVPTLTDTLTAADSGNLNRYTNAARVTVTLPTDAAVALPSGFWCALFAEGAGGVRLSTTGVSLAGSGAYSVIAQNETMIVVKTGDPDTWITVGGTALT